MSTESRDVQDRYWAKTRKLTILVLAFWVFFALIVPTLVAPLNSMSFLGFPLGYYLIVQGSLVAFVVMIWLQNWCQDAIDDEFGFDDDA